MNKFKIILMTGSLLGLLVTGCSKDNDTPDPDNGTNEKYVISTLAITGSSGTGYIFTADDISTGTISTTGNGYDTESLSTGIFLNNKLFSLAYGGTSQGPITVYTLDANGNLVKGATVNAPSANVTGIMNDDELIIGFVPRIISTPMAEFSIIDAVNPQIKSTASLNIIDMRGSTGEMAHFTGLFQVGNKVYAPFMSIKGIDGDNFGSDYLDNSWVAVLSYPSLALEKIIEDDRASYIGSYAGGYGLQQMDNGDVYTFSTGVDGSTKPSAALRIKSGTTEFDQSYIFDIETASGGLKLARALHVSGNIFLAEMYTAAGITAGLANLAVIDVVNKTFDWVENGSTYILGYLNTPIYVENDGASVVIPMMDLTGVFSLYSVDIASRTAVKGVEISGVTMITAISKLTY